VVYSAAGAIHKSTDGGRTWKTVLAPKQWGWFGASRVAIAPTRPESIYAIAHTVLNGAPGDTTIYKSADAGKTWQTTGGGSSLPPSCCADSEDALAVDPENPQTLYAAVGATILATTDGGASWQPIANGLPANDVTSLAVDPRRSGTVYAGVEINLNRVNHVGAVHGAIYKTTDGGQTWGEIFSGFGVDKVAVDPARPSTIYAAGWAHWDKTHGDTFRLARSTDGGHTWISAR
ncbi:MAG: WD40/YVTN/BNR-like repeat-containing protein, partial [Gaiellaceae bacterium]